VVEQKEEQEMKAPEQPIEVGGEAKTESKGEGERKEK